MPHDVALLLLPDVADEHREESDESAVLVEQAIVALTSISSPSILATWPHPS